MPAPLAWMKAALSLCGGDQDYFWCKCCTNVSQSPERRLWLHLEAPQHLKSAPLTLGTECQTVEVQTQIVPVAAGGKSSLFGLMKTALYAAVVQRWLCVECNCGECASVWGQRSAVTHVLHGKHTELCGGVDQKMCTGTVCIHILV